MKTKNFIEKAVKIHNNKFIYDKTNYINAKTKIEIICKVHGSFYQTPDNHLKGKGCSKCTKNHKYTTKEIINKFSEVHRDTYLYNKVDYEGIFKKIIICCKIHGEFLQTPKNHISGKGCPYCSGRIITKKQILERFRKTHKDLYMYTDFNFKNVKQKIEIVCKKHGIFKQMIDCHMRGAGCPICKKSKGEKTIRNFLIDKSIMFEEQKTFNNCINPETGKNLLFDFYISERNLCIEYDGEQHFKPMRFSKANKTLELIQKRDKIKNDFCTNNNINLLRITYRQFKEISSILDSIF